MLGGTDEKEKAKQIYLQSSFPDKRNARLAESGH